MLIYWFARADRLFGNRKILKVDARILAVCSFSFETTVGSQFPLIVGIVDELNVIERRRKIIAGWIVSVQRRATCCSAFVVDNNVTSERRRLETRLRAALANYTVIVVLHDVVAKYEIGGWFAVKNNDVTGVLDRVVLGGYGVSGGSL